MSTHPNTASHINHPQHNAFSAENQHDNDILATAAHTLLQAGYSVIPCGVDKRPTIPSWKPFQARLMTSVEANKHFLNATRLAVVCGAVSGNLECLDFDDPSTFEPFKELLEMMVPGLAKRLIHVQTPSGGFHLLYRSLTTVAGNLKLACDQAGEVRIETRGEGGYFLTSPAPEYIPISGNLATECPVLTAEEVATIHSTAKAFDLRPQAAQGATKGKDNGDSPGTRFNQAHSVTDILERHDWKRYSRTALGEGWTRPEKKSGVSGVLLDSTGNLYVFSTNASPLEPDRSYDAFGLYTMYNYGGDFKAAARSLSPGINSLDSFNSCSESTDEWLPTTPEWPVLSPKALHGIAGEFVRLATENSEADPAAVLMTFLVRFAAEVGRGPYLNVGDTQHRCRLAAVLVGASSKARKGTSYRPVAKLFQAERYETARTSPGPFSSGEGIIHAVRDGVQQWDGKTQEYAVADPGVTDKRFFIMDEEFGGALANTKREGNTLSTVLRAAWDTGTLDPLTKTSKTTATGAHICWVSHITQHELYQKLGGSEGFNGFANRILWTCVRRQKLVPIPEPMDETRLQAIRDRLFGIIDKLNERNESNELNTLLGGVKEQQIR